MEKHSHSHAVETIRCPKCAHDFALTDGLISEVKDGLRKEYEDERISLLESISSQKSLLSEQSDALRAKEAAIESKVAAGINERLKAIREEEAKKALERNSTEMNDLKTQLTEKGEALNKMRQIELDLRKRQRELEVAREDQQIELARTLDAERAKIQAEAVKKADEANQFKVADKDKTIADLLKQVDEMKRKAEQGSVQRQGQLLELSLESELTAAFPHDHFSLGRVK